MTEFLTPLGSPSFIFALCVLIAIAALGHWPVRIARETRTAVVGEAFAHGVGCLGLFVMLYFAAPGFKTAFADIGVRLPALMNAVLITSDLVVSYVYLFLPAAACLVTLETMVFSRLHRSEDTRNNARIWSIAITILLFCLLLAAIAGPMLCYLNIVSDLT